MDIFQTFLGLIHFINRDLVSSALLFKLDHNFSLYFKIIKKKAVESHTAPKDAISALMAAAAILTPGQHQNPHRRTRPHQKGGADM